MFHGLVALPSPHPLILALTDCPRLLAPISLHFEIIKIVLVAASFSCLAIWMDMRAREAWQGDLRADMRLRIRLVEIQMGQKAVRAWASPHDSFRSTISLLSSSSRRGLPSIRYPPLAHHDLDWMGADGDSGFARAVA